MSSNTSSCIFPSISIKFSNSFNKDNEREIHGLDLYLLSVVQISTQLVRITPCKSNKILQRETSKMTNTSLVIHFCFTELKIMIRLELSPLISFLVSSLICIFIHPI